MCLKSKFPKSVEIRQESNQQVTPDIIGVKKNLFALAIKQTIVI